MAENSTPAAPAAGTPAAAPAAPAAPAKATVADRIAAAAKALSTPAPAAPAPAAEPAAAAPPLPSTPVAPATEAVLRAEETASAQIRERNALSDARKAFEAEQARWTQETRARLARAEQLERLAADIDRDPAAFIKAKEGGRTADQIARDIYLETVDVDRLPPEQQAIVKDHRERRALERRQAQLEADLAREKQQRAMAEVHQQLATYRGELAAGLSALGDGTPLVRELAGKRPDLVLGLMMDVAGRLAIEAPQSGKQSTAALAERVEQALAAELEPFHGYFERRYKPAAPPPQAAAAASVAAPPAQAAPAITPTLTDTTPVRRQARTMDERIAAATRALGGQHN